MLFLSESCRGAVLPGVVQSPCAVPVEGSYSGTEGIISGFSMKESEQGCCWLGLRCASCPTRGLFLSLSSRKEA